VFESLSEKLNGVFQRLGSKGRLTEKDVDRALRDVRMALLEADVNFKVARDLVARIRQRAIGDEVLKSLSPGQQVVKITNEEITSTLGGESSRISPPTRKPGTILMVGLNGSGKTTSSNRDSPRSWSLPTSSGPRRSNSLRPWAPRSGSMSTRPPTPGPRPPWRRKASKPRPKPTRPGP
jgi:hypothetical protein